MAPYMKCGHTAQAIVDNVGWVCPICFGLTPDAAIISDQPPPLENREARCAYCLQTKKSDLALPFFEHRSWNEYDSYYCGCRGWD